MPPIDIDTLQTRLSNLLIALGWTTYSAEELRADVKECRDEIQADAVAHGDAAADPFFDLTVADGFALIVIYEVALSLYAFACDEWKTINRFEKFPVTDIKQCHRLLAREYQKMEPDVVIEASLANEWLA